MVLLKHMRGDKTLNLNSFFPMIKSSAKTKKESRLFYLIILLLLSCVLVFVYFSFSTIVTPDSIDYYNYLKILQGDIPLGSWDPVRGPSMPLVIYATVSLLGNTSLGFLVGTFIFFIITVVAGSFIIYEVFKYKDNRRVAIIAAILFIIFFVFNPLIIGYYHVMLTEFIAATVAVLSCLLSIKWIDTEINKNALKFVFYSLTFIFLSVFMWFVKQPYVITTLIPLIIATFLSINKIRNLKKHIVKALCSFRLFRICYDWYFLLGCNSRF